MIQLPFTGSKTITRRFGGNGPLYWRFGTPGAPMYGHNGIDFALKLNDPLLAVADGTMTEVASDPAGYGLYGVLTDGSGTQWLYGHAARWHVRAGAVVRAGQHIADGDSSGNSTGHHLHFAKRPKGYNRSDGYFGYVNPRHDLPIPYRVLLQGAHYPNGGGAPGEAQWAWKLAGLIRDLLVAQGVAVEVVGDYYGKPVPAPAYQDWDLYVSLHYDAYQPPGYTSGACAARGDGETEHWEADRFKDLWLAKYPPAMGIPLAMHRVGPEGGNMRGYYGFRPLSAVTPGVILEHGCGQGDDKAKLHDGIGLVAAADAAIILSYLGIAGAAPQPEPAPDGELPMDTTEAERAEYKPYFEQLGIAVNMETGLMKRAALSKKRQEERGPAISTEYTTRNRQGILVARQRFTGGTLDYHLEGAHAGETFWGEVVAHPEDAA